VCVTNNTCISGRTGDLALVEWGKEQHALAQGRLSCEALQEVAERGACKASRAFGADARGQPRLAPVGLRYIAIESSKTTRKVHPAPAGILPPNLQKQRASCMMHLRVFRHQYQCRHGAVFFYSKNLFLMIVLTETKFSFRCIPVWIGTLLAGLGSKKRTHVIMFSP
jgi:hypothetical protein